MLRYCHLGQHDAFGSFTQFIDDVAPRKDETRLFDDVAARKDEARPENPPTQTLQNGCRSWYSVAVKTALVYLRPQSDTMISFTHWLLRCA